MEDTTTDDGGDKLLKEEDQEGTADESEVEVVDEEKGLELERFAVAHHLATTKDDGIVDNNEDGCRLQSRHGSLKGDKLEVIGRVADNSSPSLVKDGPQVDAKGAIDRRPGELVEKRSRHSGQFRTGGSLFV